MKVWFSASDIAALPEFGASLWHVFARANEERWRWRPRPDATGDGCGVKHEYHIASLPVRWWSRLLRRAARVS